MPQTRRSGLRINYKIMGSGSPLVLIHGYTASGESNWVTSGWADYLAGRHTLLIPDLRGHGRSQKPYSSEAYSVAAMAADVLAVMDKEGIDRAPVFGYSMGGMVTLELLLEHPDRVSSAIIGGMGSYFPRRRGRFSIERQDKKSSAPRRSIGQQIRFLTTYVARFDPIAIDAAYRGVFKNGRPVDPARLAEIRKPVLVVAGELDPFCAPAKALSAAIPGAKFVSLPHEGHLSAIRNPQFRSEVAGFLQEVSVAKAV
ncbi:MAG: alpha/beta hydrolase [bacterium]